MGAHKDESFLALLVQRGHLELADAQVLLPGLRAGGDLDQLLEKDLGWSADKVRLLRLTRAGEQPRLPGYEVLARVGVGGTAEVFKARDQRAGGRLVALKVLSAKLARNGACVRAFAREGRLLEKLEHRAIVKGYGLKKSGDTIFSVLEWVDGLTLLEVLEQRAAPLPEADAFAIILQVAEALRALAQQGLVHRDVKPGNIMSTTRGEVKLIDLGFCATSGETNAAEMAAGTAEYLAPEQALGGGSADLRSDIYSLGATLFQLTIGRLPFEPGQDDDVLRQHVMEVLRSPELKGRGHSPHLHYFIEKMMAKDAGERYQTFDELIDDMKVQIEGARSADFRNPRARG